MATDLETVTVFLNSHGPEPPAHDLSITKLAAWGHLVASRRRVSGEFGPFDTAGGH